MARGFRAERMNLSPRTTVCQKEHKQTFLDPIPSSLVFALIKFGLRQKLYDKPNQNAFLRFCQGK